MLLTPRIRTVLEGRTDKQALLGNIIIQSQQVPETFNIYT